MLRKLVIGACCAAFFAAPSTAAPRPLLLMPGVTYEREVEFTPHGPVVIHVLRAPRPGGLHQLRPVLSNESLQGRERVTVMQRRYSGLASLAGVNGDMFGWHDGHPSGMYMQGGVLASPPLSDRSSVGVAPDGTLQVARVRFDGVWRGTGQERRMALNQRPGPRRAALYTSAWGGTTPYLGPAVAAVLMPFPPTTPGRDLVGTVVQLIGVGGRVSIPPGGAVLVGRGRGAAELAAEAPVGTPVTVRLTLTPDWSQLQDAIGGGPVIVRDGKAVFRSDEMFTYDQLVPRHPRTAIGQSADGRVILVAVDGRGYSAGMTNFELAQALTRLGAVNAMALDAGGSTTMAFDGKLLNRPSDPGGERAVADGLFVFYYGVYAAPPADEVVSPNGDGIAEQQRLAFKLVRLATVTAKLVGPDSATRVLFAGRRDPGTYRLTWAGASATGAAEPEGSWRFVVEALDTEGRASTADRTFSLNRTLGFLEVQPRSLRLRRGSVRATFALARPARVRATVLTASGAFVRTLAVGSLQAGAQSVRWNGRDGRGALVHSGRYRISITAQNETGSVALTASFSARR